ncbi:small multidrug resistance protein [Pseudobacteroides cellulosolvens ATCC 35603 = DSM 2933]|uniref:Small multidrug resistance protein n=1 Tax=Pseudobacteroides cellulosolvens ATCC 35603 = DSM 2933 TaxID=398512 RepID=A0A0L6JWH3_9FIRM|nr:small multidrug resistance protein [Pseudobacteroides cellulosolvens ATCC 35603 = DSM 2933]
MKWLLLVIVGLLGVWWAIGLKYSQGFTKLVPNIFTIFGMIASFYFLSLALKSLPLNCICNLDRNRYCWDCNFRVFY